jgi:hypothetical protein
MESLIVYIMCHKSVLRVTQVLDMNCQSTFSLCRVHVLMKFKTWINLQRFMINVVQCYVAVGIFCFHIWYN